MKLSRNSGINIYVIELVEDKQLSDGSIYTHSPIKLEIFQTYIEIYQKTEFI